LSHLQCAKVISGTKFKVFDYLVSPANLAEQLAEHIDVKLQNPGVEVAAGSEFLFLMTRFGIEQPIRFVVDRMVIGNSLTYRQVSGVYAQFVHTMKFEEHGQNETLVTDLLEYEIPFGLFGRLADDFFIRSDLKKLLEARLEVTKQKFENELDKEPVTTNDSAATNSGRTAI
jgi:ligand-binding SRPBCC domain-containing protein